MLRDAYKLAEELERKQLIIDYYVRRMQEIRGSVPLYAEFCLHEARRIENQHRVLNQIYAILSKNIDMADSNNDVMTKDVYNDLNTARESVEALLKALQIETEQ